MKKLLVVLVAIATLSCSKDDNSFYEPDIESPYIYDVVVQLSASADGSGDYYGGGTRISNSNVLLLTEEEYRSKKITIQIDGDSVILRTKAGTFTGELYFDSGDNKAFKFDSSDVKMHMEIFNTYRYSLVAFISREYPQRPDSYVMFHYFNETNNIDYLHGTVSN